MRDDDDDIRPYVPVVQRLIIIVAVIVAVPVVLWTITAFIRTYIGPPHAPNYQRLAVLQPGTGTESAPVGPPQDITPAAAAMPAAAVQTPTTADPIATPSQPPSLMAPASAPISPAHVSVTPLSAAPTVWPGSPMVPQRLQAPSDGPADAALEQPAAGNDDDAAAVAPIAGTIPLPRRRPHVIAMAQAGALQPMMAANSVLPAAVPLPRARPAAAPEALPDTPGDARSFTMEQMH